MADEAKEKPAQAEGVNKGEVALINRGERTYHTKKGPLHPGQSITVSEKEAAALLDYRDIVDASKAVPAVGRTIDDLRNQLDEANAKIAKLQAELEKSKKK